MPVEVHVITKQVDPSRVELCYHNLMKLLEDEDFNRVEVMCAIAVCLGTQWKGSVMGEKETEAYIKGLMDWHAAYFVSGREN